MTQTDDPNGYERRYNRQLELLREHPYEKDANAIRAFNFNAMSGREPSTRGTHLCNLRKMSRIAYDGEGQGLTDINSVGEFTIVLEAFETGNHPEVQDGGLSPGGQRNKRQSARLFFKYLGQEWAKQITVGSPEDTTISADDVLLGSEINAVMQAANNPRDKALVMTVLDTGMRLSALLSIRVGDVDFADDPPTVHVNEDAVGLKGYGGERPLLAAAPYMKNWLDVHPARDDLDAALFCGLKSSGGGFAEKREIGDPVAPSTARRTLTRLGERAGIDKPTHPHAFRHSAVTRMLRDGVPEQRIKWMVGWGPDSSQFERYGHLTDEDHILAHAKDHGYEVEAPEIGKQSLDECPKCGYGFLIHDPLACPSCGLSLSHNAEVVAQAHEAAEAAKDRVTERTMDETDPEAIKGAKAILETLGDEDTVLEVAEILQYLTDDETDLTRLAERAEATADADK